jgi:hypothetical protein
MGLNLSIILAQFDSNTKKKEMNLVSAISKILIITPKAAIDLHSNVFYF